jgi:hypothetical protein
VVDILAVDEVTEFISEVESSGNPSRRTSLLEHHWRFADVKAGMKVYLIARAWAESNADGDDFRFEYSTDAGSSWSSLLVIPNGTDSTHSDTGIFPPGMQGDILLRIVDTDLSEGSRSLDGVQIDQLLIRTELDPADKPPAAPTIATILPLSSSEVRIDWMDNSDNDHGFEI